MLNDENNSYLLNENESIRVEGASTNVNNESYNNVKPDGRISDKELSSLKEFYRTSKSSSVSTLVCWCLFILIIPLFIASIIQLIWSIKCVLLKNEELKQDAILWGILGLIVLPIIPIFVMKNKVLAVIQKYDPNFNAKRK